MSNLPEPVFVSTDVEALTAELIGVFENAANIVLQPAQVEHLLIDLIAYVAILNRQGINYAAKQNLVNYAIFPMLDYLGELVGAEREGEAAAATTLRYALVAAQAFDVLVPAGNRVESKDGQVVFETAEPLTIAAGATTGDVKANCQTAGVAGNGYLAGDVATMLDPVAYVAGVTNTTTTTGGAAAEEDDRYRSRIKLAPESFSVAGPRGAYLYFTLKAHPTIMDAAIIRGAEGVINVYPLTSTGNPTQEVLDAVAAELDPETVVPLSDERVVAAPIQVDFSIVGNLTVLSTAPDANAVLAEVEAALEAYVAGLRLKFARDIVPDRISGVANAVVDVYRFELTSPAFADLAGNEWANCTSITVNLVGVADG